MEIPRHDSIRGEFAYQLHKQMEANPDIWLVLGDLGYAMWDYCRRDFPERVVNVGAAEQTMLGVAVGLALEHKTVLTYTITSFYLRAAETIGLYLDGEQIPVKLIGSGRNDDYKHDGPSHDAIRAQKYLDSLNIKTMYPEHKEDMRLVLTKALKNNRPTFISLRR